MLETYRPSVTVGKDDNFASLSDEATQLRQEIVYHLHRSGGGHFGGALSVVDILVCLYRNVIHRNERARGEVLHRVVFSKGHSCIALYCMLSRMSLIDPKSLDGYGSFESSLEGHPDMLSTPGISFSTGSLGQGLSAALGMAFALSKRPSMIWCVLGDGECQEGQVWEAAALASRYRVSNLCAIVDANGQQEYGWQDFPSLAQEPVPQISERFRSFGWDVTDVDGHDHRELTNAFAKRVECPHVVIARTRKGSGVPLIERDPLRFHCTSLSDMEFEEITRSFK